MAGYKGVGIVFVRTRVRETGVEPALLAGLAAGARETLQQASATGWYPIEHVNEIFVKAAPLLFPSNPAPLRELGRQLARDNLGGVYRFAVRLISVPALIRQTATLWRTYHNAGRATATFSEKSALLELHGYPDLPERFRESMCGWIAEAIELCGGANARVLKEDNPPFCWRITWRLRRLTRAAAGAVWRPWGREGALAATSPVLGQDPASLSRRRGRRGCPGRGSRRRG